MNLVWPVDGEEQVVDTDHDLVPEWAGVAVALSQQLTVAVDHELSQVQNQSAKFKSIFFSSYLSSIVNKFGEEKIPVR